MTNRPFVDGRAETRHGVSRWLVLVLMTLGISTMAVGTLAFQQHAMPTAAAVKPPIIADLRTAASELPQLRSLLVSWRGEMIAEHYAAGAGASRLANVKSASKSLISTLVGIAIQRGLIKSIDEPIKTYFPELTRDADRRKQEITIED